jgi:hypothetical protein
MDLEQQKKALNECLESLELTKKSVLEKLKEIEEEEQPKFNEPWKPKNDDTFYFLDAKLDVNYDEMPRCYIKQIKPFYIDNGNCFKTREQAEQRAKEIKVYNLLKNFSDANGGGDIDYLGEKSFWFIAYSFLDKSFYVAWQQNAIAVNTVYFTSKEVAEEALKKYHKELEELRK